MAAGGDGEGFFRCILMGEVDGLTLDLLEGKGLVFEHVKAEVESEDERCPVGSAWYRLLGCEHFDGDAVGVEGFPSVLEVFTDELPQGVGLVEVESATSGDMEGLVGLGRRMALEQHCQARGIDGTTCPVW